jgi:enoyl-CoA hydratase
MPAPNAFDTLLIQTADQIARVTLNRPDMLNALNRQVITELSAAMEQLRADDAIRGVIITGSGDTAFAVGADIDALAQLTPAEAKALAREGQALMDMIESLGKPVIAALNGYAIGAGCELALACTMRIAADQARLAQPEARIGLIPGFGGTQRLPRLIGKGRALQMILSGDMMDAQEACRIGLVDEIVPKKKLIDRAEAILWTIATNAPLAIRFALEAVNAGFEMTQAQGLEREADLFALAAATEDAKEGTAAFVENRKPRFTGR